jgi:hypothetical protein
MNLRIEVKVRLGGLGQELFEAMSQFEVVIDPTRRCTRSSNRVLETLRRHVLQCETGALHDLAGRGSAVTRCDHPEVPLHHLVHLFQCLNLLDLLSHSLRDRALFGDESLDNRERPSSGD